MNLVIKILWLGNIPHVSRVTCDLREVYEEAYGWVIKLTQRWRIQPIHAIKQVTSTLLKTSFTKTRRLTICAIVASHERCNCQLVAWSARVSIKNNSNFLIILPTTGLDKQAK